MSSGSRGMRGVLVGFFQRVNILWESRSFRQDKIWKTWPIQFDDFLFDNVIFPWQCLFTRDLTGDSTAKNSRFSYR